MNPRTAPLVVVIGGKDSSAGGAARSGRIAMGSPADDPSASGDPVSPSAPAPSFGAASLKIPFNFFFVFDPDRGYSASFGGILTLTSGGRARMLGVGNVVFDEFGNVIVREDHFQLKPIGN